MVLARDASKQVDDSRHIEQIENLLAPMHRERPPETIGEYKSDWSARSALHHAAAQGYTSVVEQLVAAGWQVNWVLSYGETPLFMAALHGHSDTVNLLLKSSGYGMQDGRPAVKARLQVANARSPFIAAVAAGSQECLDVMTAGHEPPTLQAKEETYVGISAAVCLAALKSRDELEIWRLLGILETEHATTSTTRHAHIEYLTKGLFYAAAGGKSNIFNYLKKHADVNTERRCFRSWAKHTVLHKAVEHDRQDMVEKLLQNQRFDRELLRDMADKTALDFARADSRLSAIQLHLESVNLTEEGVRSAPRKTKYFCQAVIWRIYRGRNEKRMNEKLLAHGHVFYPRKLCDWEVLSHHAMYDTAYVLTFLVMAALLKYLMKDEKGRERSPEIEDGED